MTNVSVRLQPEYIETLDAEAEEHDMSRAEYIRDMIERGRDSEAIIAEHERKRDELRTEYEHRIAELERENDRLRREHRQLLEQREENKELVRYAKERRSATQREQHRREQWQDAPIWTKAKWVVLGYSDDSAEA